MARPTIEKTLESRLNRPVREILQEHARLGLSPEQGAAALGMSFWSYRKLLRDHGFETGRLVRAASDGR